MSPSIVQVSCSLPRISVVTLPRFATIVPWVGLEMTIENSSAPSIRVSSRVGRLKIRAGGMAPLSKVSVLPVRVTPAVASAAVWTSARKALRKSPLSAPPTPPGRTTAMSIEMLSPAGIVAPVYSIM